MKGVRIEEISKIGDKLFVRYNSVDKEGNMPVAEGKNGFIFSKEDVVDTLRLEDLISEEQMIAMAIRRWRNAGKPNIIGKGLRVEADTLTTVTW